MILRFAKDSVLLFTLQFYLDRTSRCYYVKVSILVVHKLVTYDTAGMIHGQTAVSSLWKWGILWKILEGLGDADRKFCCALLISHPLDETIWLILVYLGLRTSEVGTQHIRISPCWRQSHIVMITHLTSTRSKSSSPHETRVNKY